MKKIFITPDFPHIIYGADYNPEQWIKYPDILSDDLSLMKLANVNEATLGVFSWSSIEPEEGNFDFSFLQSVMDNLAANGCKVILATPSAGRPAWLNEKYPEVLRVNNRYEKMHSGLRANHCPSSKAFRERVTIVNRELSKRFSSHPALLAWHISNEYNGECFCEHCCENFRAWLKNKYGTLENLNDKWWTAFWSHTYTDWSQIEPPSPVGERRIHGLSIDWKRFVTYQTADFMKCEIEAVREFSKDKPVTTNFMGYFNGLDYRVLAKELDFISDDLYPLWRGREEDDIKAAARASMTHDLSRSYKNQPFLLMESTPSLVNWHEYNKPKRPKMNELSSLQAVAHGADSVQYFQWRKSRGCSEKFHGAVVDHDGTSNTRVFREVAELGKRLSMLDSIVGTYTNSDVALIYDWDNRWAIDTVQGFCNKDKKYMQTLQQWYEPLWRRGINADIISEDADFSRYKLIIAPMLYMASKELIEKIEQYVAAGGRIICTYMTGMADENDLCWLGGFPADNLKDVFGIKNEEIDTLYPDESNIVVYGEKTFKAVDYCEVIHTKTAKALAFYRSDYYSGYPAATVNCYKNGKAYYVAFRDCGDFTDSIVNEALSDALVKPCIEAELPKGVTAHSRTDGDYEFIFIQNFSKEDKTIILPTDFQAVYAENEDIVNEKLHLSPYETVIIKKRCD